MGRCTLGLVLFLSILLTSHAKPPTPMADLINFSKTGSTAELSMHYSLPADMFSFFLKTAATLSSDDRRFMPFGSGKLRVDGLDYRVRIETGWVVRELVFAQKKSEFEAIFAQIPAEQLNTKSMGFTLTLGIDLNRHEVLGKRDLDLRDRCRWAHQDTTLTWLTQLTRATYTLTLDGETQTHGSLLLRNGALGVPVHFLFTEDMTCIAP